MCVLIYVCGIIIDDNDDYICTFVWYTFSCIFYVIFVWYDDPFMGVDS